MDTYDLHSYLGIVLISFMSLEQSQIRPQRVPLNENNVSSLYMIDVFMNSVFYTYRTMKIVGQR